MEIVKRKWHRSLWAGAPMLSFRKRAVWEGFSCVSEPSLGLSITSALLNPGEFL